MITARRHLHRVLAGFARRVDPGRPLLPAGPARPDPSPLPKGGELALIAGPFSYSGWKATFGDTAAMRVAARWFESAGIPYDLACDPANGLNGVDLEAVDPSAYTIFAYVCGPWDAARRERLLPRFGHAVKIGMNLSVLEPQAHGFDYVVPRDAGGEQSADFAFAEGGPPDLPLVGLALVHRQSEYHGRQRHGEVEGAVAAWIERAEAIALPIDTLHVDNRTSTRDAGQLVGLMRRLDAVISSRLHGMVFALRTGVPVVAIDPVLGGAKVSAQARALGWPVVLKDEDISPDALSTALARCLEPEARRLAAEVGEQARRQLGQRQEDFLSAIAKLTEGRDQTAR